MGLAESIDNAEMEKVAIFAAERGDLDSLKRLFTSCGNFLNIVDRETSFSLIHIAIHHNNQETIDFLLSYDGINVNTKTKNGITPLMLSAKKGSDSVGTLNTLLKLGAKVNEVDLESNWTVLHYAAYSNCIESIQALIKAGVNANIQDTYGHTALHVAASCGHLEAVSELIQCGSDIELLDCEENDALGVASSEEVVEALEAAKSKQCCSLGVEVV